MVNVRQNHIVPHFPRLANMAWTLEDLTPWKACKQFVQAITAVTNKQAFTELRVQHLAVAQMLSAAVKDGK